MVQPVPWRSQLLRRLVCVLWNRAHINNTSPAKPARPVPGPAGGSVCVGWVSGGRLYGCPGSRLWGGTPCSSLKDTGFGLPRVYASTDPGSGIRRTSHAVLISVPMCARPLALQRPGRWKECLFTQGLFSEEPPRSREMSELGWTGRCHGALVVRSERTWRSSGDSWLVLQARSSFPASGDFSR